MEGMCSQFSRGDRQRWKGLSLENSAVVKDFEYYFMNILVKGLLPMYCTFRR